MYNFTSLTRSVFLILLFVAVACNGRKEAPAEMFIGEPSSIEVSIEGMTCTGCEQTIQNNVEKIKGVKSVKASWKEGKALVEFFPEMTDTLEIKDAVTGSGYKVNHFNTPDPVQNN
jgi:copper chaperone CopZ